MTKPSAVRITGPLAAHACGFRDELAALHYTALSGANQMRAKRFRPFDALLVFLEAL